MAVVDDVIRIAKGEIGYHEGRSNGHWNNDQKYSDMVPGLEWSDKQAWCATFVSWVALKANAAALFPRTASCDLGMKWFKDRGRFDRTPRVGDQVFFGVPGDSNHTGIVVAVGPDVITTVEGNTNTSGSREGDGVYLRARARSSANILGYGHPAYPKAKKKPVPNVKAAIKATKAIAGESPEELAALEALKKLKKKRQEAA